MSRLLVLKFGGHALGSAARIRLAARRIAAWRRRGDRVVAVASARAGTTDRLLRLAGRCSGAAVDPRELDRLLATGEDRSATLLALALQGLGIEARSLRGGEAGLLAEGEHGAGRIISVNPAALRSLVLEGVVPVVSGFQAERADGESVTLGRGGSDLTGVVLAAALNAAECHLIKDVDGVHPRDPRAGNPLPHHSRLSHDELHHLIREGARVVHHGAAALARDVRVTLLVYGYRAPLQGTGTRIEDAA